VYYENGQVRYTKNYDNDVAIGLWEFFDENGDLLGKVMYENGKKLWQEGVAE
jgi:antitoxin component YwqK of YwqJK toxin-antitoxin module